MMREFGGDYRIVRVCMESKDPLETYHKIKTGHYSISTFLDFLEILDVKETLKEDQIEQEKRKRPPQAK
jgi:hypothetical protein